MKTLSISRHSRISKWDQTPTPFLPHWVGWTCCRNCCTCFCVRHCFTVFFNSYVVIEAFLLLLLNRKQQILGLSAAKLKIMWRPMSPADSSITHVHEARKPCMCHHKRTRGKSPRYTGISAWQHQQRLLSCQSPLSRGFTLSTSWTGYARWVDGKWRTGKCRATVKHKALVFT